MNLKIHAIDVETTFLHAMLQEEIYVKQPKGFVDPTKPNHMCRLACMG